MKYTILGKSGLDVSRIAFGTWQLGGDWGPTDPAAALQAIRRAADQGVTFFDTAQAYGFGRSEQLLGEALRQLPREELVIATKAACAPPTAASHAMPARRGSAKGWTPASRRWAPSTSIYSRCTGSIPLRRSNSRRRRWPS